MANDERCVEQSGAAPEGMRGEGRCGVEASVPVFANNSEYI